MDEDLQKQIAARVAELPEDIQLAIDSPENAAHLQEIGKKHQLRVDQVGMLEDETLLVMLGFAEAGEFVKTLAEGLGVEQQKAEAIAADVNTMVFLPIRESMKRFMAARAAAPTPPAPAAVAPAATPQPAVPAIAHELHPADVMLSEKKVTVPPVAQPPVQAAAAPVPTTAPSSGKPEPYKQDPYREPPE